MSRQVSQRRRSGHSAQFGAPWGRVVKLITGVSTALLLMVMALPWIALSDKPAPWWVRWTVPTIIIAVFAGISLFCVRGFTVRKRELWIQRLLWQTRIPLQDLQAVRVDPTAMKRSIRTAGNGGFLAFTGWFHNKKLGNYRAYVTDPSRCVVMEFRNRKVVVSPHDPAGLVRAFGFGVDSEPNKG